MLHDKIIISTIYKSKLPKYKYLKHPERYPNITRYLSFRFEYVETLKEALDRIKYGIEIRPICKECGKPVKYLGLNNGNLIYRNFCCLKCSNSNKDKQKKTKETCLRKYGENNPSKTKVVKEKIALSNKKTCLDKYGLCNVMKIDSVVKKNLASQEKTNITKYGCKSVFSVPSIKEKANKVYKETCLNKYGVDNPWKVKEIQEKIQQNNKLVFLNKYGVDNPWKVKEIQKKAKENYKKTCIRKYGVDNPMKNNDIVCKLKDKLNTQEVRDKIIKTKQINHTFNTSNPEELLYKKFVDKYGKDDVIRQYKSDVYPFACDFYIKSKDLYVELQGMWTHGKHAFNPDSEEDKFILEQWKEKAKTSRFYNNAIETWTISDVKKREIAKKNNLNYVEIWNVNDLK